jgi:type III restriction enzyme
MTLDAPGMSGQEHKLVTEGKRPWPKDALDAPRLGRRSVVSLAKESVDKNELIAVLRSARTLNGIHLRRRLAARNRNGLNAVNPDSYMTGDAFLQYSCQGSLAQEKLAKLADEVADHYEDRVSYDTDPDPERATWIAQEHRPRNSDMLPFKCSAHARYSRGNFNRDELAFAQALDAFAHGVWLRNADTGDLGYHVPLPFKVGDSLRFFPDFLWWPEGSDGPTWAIDTTGRHLINEKIRGKLVSVGQPHMALLTRGHVDLTREHVVGNDGWSAVIARIGLQPLVEHADDLQRVLQTLVDHR